MCWQSACVQVVGDMGLTLTMRVWHRRYFLHAGAHTHTCRLRHMHTSHADLAVILSLRFCNG